MDENVSDQSIVGWWFVYACEVNRQLHPELIGKYVSPELAQDICPLGAWLVDNG